MKWLTVVRRPESEVMEEEAGVEAYTSATAQVYLDAIDDTLVEQVISLGLEVGSVLDVGTGPGSIPLKIARRRPGLNLIGVDRSRPMLQAARAAARACGLGLRVSFCDGDALRLPFPDSRFDLVLSNSVLHHLPDPAGAFREMARVAKPRGQVLVRDLRRPSRLMFAAHLRWNGRHYSGRMKQLFEDSVRASYTLSELAELIRESGLTQARVFSHKRTHLGLVWNKPPQERN